MYYKCGVMTHAYSELLAFPMLRLLSSERKDATTFENHLIPVMLVFIGKLLLSAMRWVAMYQGRGHFQVFSHNFVMVKLATRVRHKG